MSTNQIDTDIVQGDIRYSPADHTYTHIPTGKKMASVSSVIKTVCSMKSWEAADPAVVENARRRGAAVDRYMAEYVRKGIVSITDEPSDVVDRVVIARRIWEELFHGEQVEVQKIVFSLIDGVAGSMDFFVTDKKQVVDLKSTYNAEIDWVLQLGAYCEYSDSDRAGIIHVSPKVYQYGGRWLEYDAKKCRKYWRSAVAWWKQTRDMAQDAKVPSKKN